MKKVVVIAVAMLVFSCKKESQEPFGKSEEPTTTESNTPEAIGQEIFESKGNCASCHQLDQKSIGPSIQEIAKIYKENKGNIVSFLKAEAEPIVDPSQYEVMKTNFAITEEMSDEELQALEAYIYSNLK